MEGRKGKEEEEEEAEQSRKAEEGCQIVRIAEQHARQHVSVVGARIAKQRCTTCTTQRTVRVAEQHAREHVCFVGAAYCNLHHILAHVDSKQC